MNDSAAPQGESRIRSTKRKLDDAFQILDKAVTPSKPTEGPPLKRSNTIRSFYSTLAKYGIKSPSQSASSSNLPLSTKGTPHLTAILNRAASKTKSTFSFKFSHPSTPPPPLPATAEYRPSSLSLFLSRLGTYKLTTYANKPPAIDAVAASKCGWINDGKDRLVCGICNASWVVAGREGLNREAANALIEKQRVGLVENHKSGCPWRVRQCEDSIYRIPLHSPATMVKGIKTSAACMDPVIKNVDIKHPLTTSQLAALRSTVAFYKEPAVELSAKTDNAQPSLHPPSSESEPAEAAILAALFGWTLVPPAPPGPQRRVSSRAPSVVPSVPSSPPSSRASSVSLSHSPPKPTLSFRLPSNPALKPENALLQCQFCQRRIGLWTFSSRSPDEESSESPMMQDAANETTSTPAPRPKKPLPRRPLDLLKEHRSYCPYVVRSTVVPSLPVPPMSPPRNGHTPTLSISQFNGMSEATHAMEGWRAVLTVVLRYGMAQKQRVEYNFLAPKDPADKGRQDSDAMDVDNVKAMITGVKTRGGKDLLKYVRGLLG